MPTAVQPGAAQVKQGQIWSRIVNGELLVLELLPALVPLTRWHCNAALGEFQPQSSPARVRFSACSLRLSYRSLSKA